MSDTKSALHYINKVSNISEYIHGNDVNTLHNNLHDLTKILYEYGQHEKSYKKSNKKARNLMENLLVTEHFGDDEIWSQIKDHSLSVLSTVDQRSKYRQNERQRMQQIVDELQQDLISDDADDPLQDTEDPNQPQENETPDDIDEKQEQQDDNDNNNDDDDWLDVIKDHRSNQLKDRNTETEDIKEPTEVIEDEEPLDLDEFEKQTNEMEAFINSQWDKEKEMAEDGAFDLVNDDMFERALIFDEENEHNQKHSVSEKHNDDFSFLNKYIAKDSDDDIKNEANTNTDLFNLPKLSNNEDKKEEVNTEDIISNLSKFELEEKAIKERIQKLEEENMKQRTWEYQGEVSNNKFTHPHAKRDRNSLLSTYLDFDYADKLKPKITDDLNEAIESLIITKITNNEFDDVEKKRDFASAPKIAKRKLVEIQDTKSSMGLAELYEREYLQQVEEKHKDDEGFMSTKDAELSKKYEKISRLKSSLFYELDQLVRFHYQPKDAVVKGNIKVKTNTNALYLEDMVPFAMSNEMTMTPEQLYRKPRKLGHIKGENEMTREDRKSKRRANKKRGKHWKLIRDERDTLRSSYDEKFSRHLSRIKALNEVRTHAMAAAKKNGFLNKKNGVDIERDNTKYTSSKQMFSKIQQHQDNKLKRKLQDNDDSVSVSPEKKRKIMSMMH